MNALVHEYRRNINKWFSGSRQFPRLYDAQKEIKRAETRRQQLAHGNSHPKRRTLKLRLNYIRMYRCFFSRRETVDKYVFHELMISWINSWLTERTKEKDAMRHSWC